MRTVLAPGLLHGNLVLEPRLLGMCSGQVRGHRPTRAALPMAGLLDPKRPLGELLRQLQVQAAVIRGGIHRVLRLKLTMHRRLEQHSVLPRLVL